MRLYNTSGIGFLKGLGGERHSHTGLVSVYLSGDQTISVAGSNVQIQFNSENIDSMGEWNTTSYQFVPFEDGWYVFTLNIYTDLTKTWMGAWIVKNYGGAVKYMAHDIKQYDVNANDNAFNCSTVPEYITTSDNVRFYFQTDAQPVVLDATYTWAGAYRVY